MWRFVPPWLTTPESDRGPSGSNDDAPTLPYEHGEPVISGSAVQAPWEQPADVQEQQSSMAEQVSNLTQMVSSMMEELRREDYKRADDGEPQPDELDFQELYGNPPAMQPLDAGEESHTSVPVTSQPDGQHTILFRDSQANLEETGVVGTDVPPSSASIVARFIDSPPSVTENAVLETVRASPTVATATTTLTWSCRTRMTTNINSPVTSASHTSPGEFNSSTTISVRCLLWHNRISPALESSVIRKVVRSSRMPWPVGQGRLASMLKPRSPHPTFGYGMWKEPPREIQPIAHRDWLVVWPNLKEASALTKATRM